MAKILIAAGLGSSLLRFRGELIKSWLETGHQVVAAAPDGDAQKPLQELGAGFNRIPLKRSSLNPLNDLWLLIKMKILIRREKPDYLLFYTAKPVIYGSLAAYFYPRGKVFSMITGLGYAFSGELGLRAFLRKLMIFLYRVSLARNDKVFFQNPDDCNMFRRLNLVKADQAFVTNGSGVNITDFNTVPLPGEKANFLMIARLVREKGFAEYVEAARIVKRRHPRACFKLIGWALDDSPSSINRDEVNAWQDEGIVKVIGATEDVRPHIAGAGVYVLPSYYGEGTPRTILEAMAMGRPIITTDSPGCRETVANGLNGFLVPVKDSMALAEAMEKFIKEPALAEQMGAESRKLAVDKYDVRKINRIINSEMGLT